MVYIIKNHMDASMTENVMLITAKAFTLYNETNDVCKHIKQHIERTYGGIWHCIIGDDFALNITSTESCYIIFKYEDQKILLFEH